MDVSDDKFRVFISHKHDDHVLAERVKCLIESLNKKTITCFVSGVDITAGSDWRRVVRDSRPEPHASTTIHGAVKKLGLVPVRNRSVHSF